jgi:hypothetical protein
MTGIRKLLKEDIKEQSKEVADYMITQEPTMTNHPITPPPELVREWQREANHNEAVFPQVAAQAAQWGADQQLKLDAEQIAQAYQKGADQELEACCEWLDKNGLGPNSLGRLRAARRPKPPSLKEQALAALEDDDIDVYLIRRALEALPND